MLQKKVILIGLVSNMAFANSSGQLAVAKQHLSEQEFMQYTHEIWEHEQALNAKKAVIPEIKQQKLMGGNTLTVGPGDDCGFPNILTALNFAAIGDTIMVAAETYTGTDAQLTIDKSVNLWGGLDSNCQVFTSELTKLDSGLQGNVITIDVSGDKEVDISGFDISGSQLIGIDQSSSGLYIVGDGTVTLRNSKIHNNHSNVGGGIVVSGEADLRITEHTEIFNNTAITAGGGIVCSGARLSMANAKVGRFHEGVAQGNITTAEDSYGGGMALYDCIAQLGKVGGVFGPVDVSYNQSTSGAGVHVQTGYFQTFEGTRLSFNQSNDENLITIDGSAIFATSVSTVILSDTEISDNKNSKAIIIDDETTLTVGSNCSQPPCAKFLRNEFGILMAKNNSLASIDQAVISDNWHHGLIHSSKSSIQVENTLITNNRNAGLVAAFKSQYEGSELVFENVTLADNYRNGSTSLMFSTQSPGVIRFKGGVMWGNSNIDFKENDTQIIVSDSVIQYEALGYENTLQTDPLFVNQEAGNYRLQYQSPAKNLVPNFFNILDIEGNTRNDDFTSDAGAYEWVDLIFRNGFEQN